MNSMLRNTDAFLCSVGKHADVVNQGIIFFGIQLAVDNGLELFEIIRKEPISPAICLMLLWYGGIACLICYYFMLELTSPTARRLYGVATLSSFGYILGTNLSVLPLSHVLSFLSMCVTLGLLGVFFPSENMLQLSGSSFLRSMGITLCALSQFSILGFELCDFIWDPFDVAKGLKLLCHIVVVVLYCNLSIAEQVYGLALSSIIGYSWITLCVLPLSYQLSLLLRIINLLNGVVCSVGVKTNNIRKLLNIYGCKLVFDIYKLFKKWRLEECSGLAEYLKVICFGGFVILTCCLGMLDDTSINHWFAGVAFLFGLGNLFWMMSTELAVWFRVCFVCVSVLLIGGIATALDHCRKLTLPVD